MWLLEGLGGGLKNFLGSLSLAIFLRPLINYAVIRPLLVTDKNVANMKHFMAAKVAGYIIIFNVSSDDQKE